MSERYVKPMVVDQGEDFITLRARIIAKGPNRLKAGRPTQGVASGEMKGAESV